MEPSTADGKSSRTQRGEDPPLEDEDVARHKKKARQEGRTIVFVDESGLSQKPHRCRTWAPRGQTPVLEFNFNWKKLSAVAGITSWNFYFRLYPGSVKSPPVVDFLKALVRHIDRPLLIVWGYWKQHELPNVAPQDYWHLSEGARRTRRRMRRRPCLITAFWKQSSLWPE